MLPLLAGAALNIFNTFKIVCDVKIYQIIRNTSNKYLQTAAL